jgi:hypothetical protein
VLAGAAPIDVAWLDLADADDVRAELEALVLEVACCFLRRGECLPRGRNRAGRISSISAGRGCRPPAASYQSSQANGAGEEEAAEVN